MNFADDIRDKGERTPDGRMSPKGASGVMQVMPGTAQAPGFGVQPAADDSPEELARVGKDYANAMLAKYGDPTLAAAAYNAGPGMVDRWLKDYGDPRDGGISVGDWAGKIPYQETRDYVGRVAGGPSGPPAAGLTAGPAEGPPPGSSLGFQPAPPVGNLGLTGIPPSAAPAAPHTSLSPLSAFGTILASHQAIPVDYNPFEGIPKAAPVVQQPESYQWPKLTAMKL